MTKIYFNMKRFYPKVDYKDKTNSEFNMKLQIIIFNVLIYYVLY